MKKTFSRLMSLALGIALVAFLAPAIPSTDTVLAQNDPVTQVCVYKDLGTRVTLTVGSETYRNQWLGLFHLTVGGESYDGWCVDLEHDIRSGQCFQATLADASRETPWCEIGYIMDNYSPGSNVEAAAIQLAIWKCKYGKDYVKVSYSGIENRALTIYGDAQGECPRVIAGYSELTLQAVGNLVVGGGRACQQFTATVTDRGVIPLQGIQIKFETPDGSFSPPSGGSLTVPTDGNGKASVTVCWDASRGSFQGSLTAYTEGYWPVIIYPMRSIQQTIILQHRELTAEDFIAWEQELGLEVTKEADTDISKVGDTITYTITVENTGAVDLDKTSIIDDVLGNLTGDFVKDPLTAGDSESQDFDYVVQPGDPDPLVNEVEAIYEDLAGNAVSDTATDSVDLVHPSIEVTKTADPTSAVVGETITYTIEVENTGDVALILDSVNDTLLTVTWFNSTLAAGDTESHDFIRNIQPGDPDPLVNTVVFHYHPQSLTNDIADEADAWVDLVSPGLEVTKEADTDISKAGDEITYTITVENTGAVDLDKTSIIDDVLGNLTGDFVKDPLTAGDSESQDFDYVVQPGDPDPLVNEVEAIYEDLAGNAFSDTATDSVDLVHPSIEVTKTANPTSAVVGETITYTIKVENTGDVALILDSVNDTLLTVTGFNSTLAVGASESHDFDRDIQPGDLDPLVNTVTFHYHPVGGLTNDITDWDDASVELVSPGLEVTKVADTEISKVGDTITYTITVENTGAVDLDKTSIIDDVLGNLTGDFVKDPLTAGDSESQDFDYVVQPGDPDPLVNEVTAIYEDLAGNALSDTATDSVDLVHPDIEVTKTADPTSGVVGETITYTITVENTGDVGLILDSVNDTLLTVTGFNSTLAVGASESLDFTRDIQSGDLDPLVNTVTFHYHPVGGLTNDITDWDDAEVEVTEPCDLQIEKRDWYTEDIVNRPGLIVRITPDPYTGTGYLDVEDNVSTEDKDPTLGIILLLDIRCDLCYDIIETQAPDGYNLDSTPLEDVCVGSVVTVTFYNTPLLGSIEILKLGLPECGVCDGKVSFLRLQYNGAAGATIEVKSKDGTMLFDGWVNSGEQFEFSCMQASGNLDNDINIYVDGGPPTYIHASCSQDIWPGMVFGDFLVVYGESSDGGPMCPLQPPYDEGVIIDLPGAKFKIELNPYGGPELIVEDNDGNDKNPANGIILLENIPLGWYTITEIAAPEGYVLDPNPQTIEVTTGETAVFEFTNPPSPPCGCEGKVSSLRLQYNGTVAASIEVTAKDGNVLYTGTVNQGDQFEFDCFKADGNLDNEITISVTGGSVTTIHTSCSKPIGPGLIVGDCEVVEGESLDGGPLCPYIKVVKTASLDGSCPGSDPLNVSLGSTVTYCYEVTNISDDTLTNVAATDDIYGPVTLGTNSLAPGQSTTGTLTHVVVAGDIPSKTNIATATGEIETRDKVYQFSDTDDCTITIDISIATGPFKTVEFWKQQSEAELTGYLAYICTNYPNSAGLYEWNGIPGEISFSEAYSALNPNWALMALQARQQYLATLLNLAANQDDLYKFVDTNSDGIADTVFADAIAQVEAILLNPGSTTGDFELARDICESINNMHP